MSFRRSREGSASTNERLLKVEGEAHQLRSDVVELRSEMRLGFEKLGDQFSKMSEARQLSPAVIMGILLTLIGIWQFLVQPFQNELVRLRHEIETNRSALQQVYTTANALSWTSSRLDSMEVTTEALRSEIASRTAGRWTKDDHVHFEGQLRASLHDLSNRLLTVEAKTGFIEGVLSEGKEEK